MLPSKLKNLKKYTILYAEDEKGIQEEIQEILKLLFKEVYIADDGRQAYELYLENKPDLIITDIKMPYLSGLEFIKKLRVNDLETSIAITTAFTDTNLMLLAIELNLLKYLIKPISKNKLYEVFNNFLNKKNKIIIIELTKEYKFNKNNACIEHNDETYNLTNKELEFLNYILDKKAIVTYEELEAILDIDNYYNENSIRQFIKKIRKKLPSNYLRNIQNQGYIISSKN